VVQWGLVSSALTPLKVATSAASEGWVGVEGLSVSVESASDAAVVTVAGEIDIASAPELRDALTQAVRGSPRRLTVDLAQVSFIDSSGLNALASVTRESPDIEVVLASPSRQCRRVLEVSGLDRVFRLEGRSPGDTAAGEPPPPSGG
jgi:anti-sigma B factor antagonist